MSNSNRRDDRSIIAFAVTVFIGIAGLIGFYEGVDVGQTKSAENYANSHQSYAADKIESTCIGLDPALIAGCIEYAIDASIENQRAEKDLSAQQNMSYWAKWLLFLMCITTAVTAFGVWYVRDTLIATQDMARETTRIGEAQVRAYVSSLETRPLYAWDEKEILHGIFFAPLIVNTGQSPAQICGLYSNITFCPPHEIPVCTFNLEDAVASTDLGGGGKTDMLEQRVTAQEAMEVWDRSKRCYIMGWIAYKTVFDQAEEENIFTFCTEVIFRIDPSKIVKGSESNALRLHTRVDFSIGPNC